LNKDISQTVVCKITVWWDI